MDEQAKRPLIEKLQKVAQAVKPMRFSFFESSAVRGVSRDGVDFIFDQQTLDEFENLLRLLLQTHAWSDKYSESFLENSLERIIAQILPTGAFDKTPCYFNALCAAYEKYDTERLVLLPLGGFRMELDALEIGNLVLRKVIPEAGFAPHGEQVWLQNRIVGLELTDAQKRLFFRDARDGMVCAEYRIVAEPTRAVERGEEECNRVLELLRFAIPPIFADYPRVEIGYTWEIINTRGSLLALQTAMPGYQSRPRRF